MRRRARRKIPSWVVYIWVGLVSFVGSLLILVVDVPGVAKGLAISCVWAGVWWLGERG